MPPSKWLTKHVERLKKRLAEMTPEEFHQLGVDAKKAEEDGTLIIGKPRISKKVRKKFKKQLRKEARR